VLCAVLSYRAVCCAKLPCCVVIAPEKFTLPIVKAYVHDQNLVAVLSCLTAIDVPLF